jgi:hypothetical protein
LTFPRLRGLPSTDLAGDQSSSPTTPLFGFRLRPGHHPANPSRTRRNGSGALSWAFAPFSTSGIEGQLPAGVACPLRSALRVWLPSRRFPPFEALPALFRAGGAHGIYPSERPPPTRFPTVSGRMDPHTVSPTGKLVAEASSRPDGPRFLGFNPRGNPSRTNTVLAHRPSDAPLGFALPGSASDSLVPDFAGPPLTRFTCRSPKALAGCAPECRSALTWPLPAPAEA